MAPPTPSAKAQLDDDNWILPIGVLIAIFAVSYWVVHDDPTANGVQFALAAAAAAVLGWGYWLTQKGRALELQILRDRLIMALGIGGALAYCNFGHLHFGNFVHVWDTYHYYMGAKYFPEVKYDLLYDCAAIADSESGLKAAAAQRTITDLRTNVMHKADQVVAHPEVCTSQFSKARWDDFKRDIAYFRGKVNAKRWEEIHQDHGYNATPVWTLAGWALSNTGAANDDQIRALNLIDPLYLILMGMLLYWAFGPRIFALGMLVLGCNFPGRYYWTGGAFLRHDWLFYTVAVVCLLRKEKFLLAGLALSYATLLRLFPGLMVIGPLLAGIEWFRVHRKLDPRFVKFVAGGALGVALLFPLSLGLSRLGSVPAEPGTGAIDIWLKFAQNTNKHASTPLTNHMGLRTVMSYRPETTGSWLRDGSAIDPWATWKATRLEKFHQARPLFILLLLGLVALMYFAIRQTGAELWMAAALGVGFIVAGAELTNYYYCFLIGMVALHEKRREVGLVLMVLLATTQLLPAGIVPGISPQLDQAYTTMTIACLAACMAIWFLFTRRGEELTLAPEGPAEIWPNLPVVETPERDERKKKKRKK